LNFATFDLASSVNFYSILLNARPQKLLSDYALFITDQPALELALNGVGSMPELNSDHYGILVETAEEVDRAITRLEAAGLVFSIEREETCCYAKQTKVWATEPTGRRWEVYAVHEETDERDTSDSTCCAATLEADGTCCTA
jgi:hypothetical protein